MKKWLRDRHFRSLLKNTSYLAVSKGVAAVGALATLAMAGRALGLETFGILILIAAYAQAANGLSKFQSWQLVIRYGGAALAKGDHETFKKAAGFGLGLDLASGVIGMLAALAILPLLGGWFGLEDESFTYAALYCLLIPSMGASSPSGMLRALDRFDLLSWQGTVTPIFRAILATIGFLNGWGLKEFVILWAVTDLTGDLFLWFLAWRELGRKGLRKGLRPSLRPIGLDNAWPFAIQVNLTSSLMAAWNPIARLLVGGLLGPAAAALYRVAASLADSAQKPADLLAKAYYPEVVRMDFTTKTPWRFMMRGLAIAGTFGVGAVVVLILLGRPLIEFMFGSEFAGVYPVLLVLTGVPLLAILAFPLPAMLLSMDRPDAPLKARIFAALIYFAIVAPMAWEFGVLGAAGAMVIGHLFVLLGLLFYLWREYRRVRATPA